MDMVFLAKLTLGQTLFIIIVPVLVVLFVSVILFFVLKQKRMKDDFRIYYYKRIYRLAMEKDYYLLNNFQFRIDDSHIAKIDHILFADKYIYIVTDAYYNGAISGKENDKSLVFTDKKGKKYYVDNPLTANKRLVNKLSIITGVTSSLLVGITLINDNCESFVKTTTNNFYLIQKNKFKPLVLAIESRDISPINKEQLANAVKAIDKLNRRIKGDREK